MRFKHYTWSPVEIAYLLTKYDKLSDQDLGYDLAKPVTEIHKKINQLALSPEHKGPKTVERMVRSCINPGCGAMFIATKYEVDRGRALYCSNTCSANAKKIPVPSKEELQLDYQQGLSTNDLAEKYQVSKGTIYNLFQRYNIESRSLAESLTEFFKTEKGTSAIRQRLKTIEKKYGTTCLGGGHSGFGTLKRGYKEDLGVSVRSGWEGNVLRWLNYHHRAWEYEPRVFFFEGIKHGTVAYTPDIYLPNEDVWIEVKGQLRPEDKTKLRRFKKFYPDEFAKLRVIIGSERLKSNDFFKSMDIPVEVYYNDIKRDFKDVIDTWE